MNNLDWNALRAGGMVALVFAVPFSFLASWLARNDDSGAATWLALLALCGFILGAGVAAWVQQRGLPLMHALICAIGTYVGAQTVFIIIRLLSGNEVRWVAAIFNLTMVGVAGMIGGGLGNAMQRRGLMPRSLGNDSSFGNDDVGGNT